jgi:hypothetical protein
MMYGCPIVRAACWLTVCNVGHAAVAESAQHLVIMVNGDSTGQCTRIWPWELWDDDAGHVRMRRGLPSVLS